MPCTKKSLESPRILSLIDGQPILEDLIKIQMETLRKSNKFLIAEVNPRKYVFFFSWRLFAIFLPKQLFSWEEKSMNYLK